MTSSSQAKLDSFEGLIVKIETVDDANHKAEASTILSPRFYTTDYNAMDRIDVTPVRAEWDVMMKEYEGDNNHDHFQRTADFTDQIRILEPALQRIRPIIMESYAADYVSQV